MKVNHPGVIAPRASVEQATLKNEQTHTAELITKLVSVKNTTLETLKIGQTAAKANRIVGPNAILTQLTIDRLLHPEHYKSNMEQSKKIAIDILSIKGAVLAFSYAEKELVIRGNNGELQRVKRPVDLPQTPRRDLKDPH